MPTVLDIARVKHPNGIQGKSTLGLMQGETDPTRNTVFAEFNDNAGGNAYPMRAIHTRDYLYIFNAWGTGENTFVSAASWHLSEGVMKGMARDNPAVAERYQFLIHRCIEEFYDLRTDPHALTNLIESPRNQERINQFRKQLKDWMIDTNDHLLEAFEARNNRDTLQEIYKELDAESLIRAETLQWKRYKNRAGGTGKNDLLYKLDKKQNRIIDSSPFKFFK
jgi:arylsulfatase A-like enzyme